MSFLKITKSTLESSFFNLKQKEKNQQNKEAEKHIVYTGTVKPVQNGY